MNTSTVKRNYLYFTLLLLKERTSKNGTHLSAEDIAQYFKDEYGLEPNRKTIYAIMKDLEEMGFDVKLEKNRAKLGYFLEQRQLNIGELNLLIDGIESLDDIKADEKRSIEEKLCHELGYSFHGLDFHLYEKRDKANEDIDEEDVSSSKGLTTVEKLEIIQKAIADNKQLEVSLSPCVDPNSFLLEEACGTAIGWESIRFISPYKVLRNRDDELCLLFYITVKGHNYPGFIHVRSMDELALSSHKRSKLKDESIFPMEISNYKNASSYRIGQELCDVTLSAELGTNGQTNLRRICEDCCETYTWKCVNGQATYKIAYKKEKEDEIKDLVLKSFPDIRIMPGSRIYDQFTAMMTGLSQVINQPLEGILRPSTNNSVAVSLS